MQAYYDGFNVDSDILPAPLPFFHVTNWAKFLLISKKSSGNLKFDSPNHEFQIYFHYGMPNYQENLASRTMVTKSCDPYPVALEIIGSDLEIEGLTYIFTPTDTGYISKNHPGTSLETNKNRLTINLHSISNLINYFRKHVYNFFSDNRSYCQSKFKEPKHKIEECFQEILDLYEFFQSEASADNRICTCELILQSDLNGPKFFNIQGLLQKIYLPESTMTSPENRAIIKKLVKNNKFETYSIEEFRNSGILKCSEKIKSSVLNGYQ